MNEDVRNKLEAYPPLAQKQFLRVRELIFCVANEESIGDVTETLKWGEPSYLAEKGSALRMDWKPKQPESLSLYFNCNSKLVATFRDIFGEIFQYEGNREIRLPLSEALPVEELKVCISMTLRYHDVKHLPLLGA